MDQEFSAVADPPASELPRRQTVDGERLLHVFKQLVEPIGQSLPSSSEVVLHDLSLLPNSIVAVHGDVTGRRVGDPATDMLLRSSISDDLETVVGYETKLADGRQLKSSTMIIRDVSGQAVAALCINSDISVWQSVNRIAQSMIGGYGQRPATDATPPPSKNHDEAAAPATGAIDGERRPEAPSEEFVHDVDELAALLIKQAIRETKVPVELMRKSHKLDVVRSLKASGMFLLRDAVEMIASALDVSRFTIYNYLNELEDDELHSNT